jgi:hypothetical protein
MDDVVVLPLCALRQSTLSNEGLLDMHASSRLCADGTFGMDKDEVTSAWPSLG